MPALERLRGLRLIAEPASVDRATWSGDQVTVLRFAPDDAFGLGARTVDVDDPDGIVEDEPGLVGAWLDPADIEPQTEWPLPTERPALAQGSIAGVPAKLWLPADGDALILTAAAYAYELEVRLGWRS